MKTTLFEVGKKTVFPQFLENLSNGMNVSLAWILDVDKDVIEVSNDKNIEFLNQNLVNIALKAGRCVAEPNRNYLVLEVAVLSPKGCLPFIAIFYPNLMVSTCEVKLGKSFCSA